ncbi:response regulator [Nevskia sp.]|uniref:response regulator n=1 Tax=Nevskia sp. TaxID=1929292 RepID=UPI003F72484F
MPDDGARLRVLLVDDEPAVLEGLELQLGRRYEVHGTTQPTQALKMIDTMAPFAIVLSDMRMPGMDGAALLREIRNRQPHGVRMLLSGHADVGSAIAAVNDGGVFRFLTKPCPPAQLLAAFDAAAQHYRVQAAERALLEQTLRGAIKALAEVLAVVDPAGHGQALRVQQLSLELAKELAFAPGWSLEVAALLSSIGRVSLPAEVLQRLHAGEIPLPDEAAMLARLPKLTDRLLAAIPRLEPARAILLLSHEQPLPEGWATDFGSGTLATLGRCAAILRVAEGFDTLLTHGYGSAEALGVLRARKVAGDAAVIDALESLRARDQGRVSVRQLPIAMLQPGMVIAGDLCTTAGQLLVTRGFVISESFLARLTNFSRGRVREPVLVMVPDGQTTPAETRSDSLQTAESP